MSNVSAIDPPSEPALPTAGTLPLASLEDARPPCRAPLTRDDQRTTLLLRFAETFHRDAIQDTDVIIARAEAILSTLSGEDQNTFLNSTLPAILPPPPYVGIERTLDALEQFVELGALGRCLPALLQAMPTSPLWLCVDRVRYISKAVGPESNRLLTEILPTIMRHPNRPFHSEDFLAFQVLCEKAGPQTPALCVEIIPELELPTLEQHGWARRFSLLSTSIARTAHHPYDCTRFYVEALRLLPRHHSEPWNLLGYILDAWNRWPPEHSVKLGQIALEVFSCLERPTAPSMVQAALEACGHGLETANHLQDTAVDLREKRRPKRVLMLLKDTVRLTTDLGEQHGPAVVRYLTAAERKGWYKEAIDLAYDLQQIFGAPRLGTNLDFVTAALSRMNRRERKEFFSDRQFLKERTTSLLHAGGPVSDTPTNYLLGGILAGGRESYNIYQLSEPVFRERWKSCINLDRPGPIHVHPGHTFPILVAPEGRLADVLPKAHLRYEFIHGTKRRFSLGSWELRGTIMKDLARLAGHPLPSTGDAPPVHELFPCIADIAKQNDEALFRRAVKISLPLVARATNVVLPHLQVKNPTEDQTFAYLETLRLLLDDRIVVSLEALNVERRFIDLFKKVACLDEVNAELRKFTKVRPSRIMVIELMSRGNVLDAFHEQWSESCLYEKTGDNLDNEQLQIVRMVNADTRDVVGCWYLLRGTVAHEPSLIMAGGGPRRSIAATMDVPHFVQGLRRELKAIAVENNLTGGLHTAVGGEPGSKKWIPEGRVAQVAEVVSALVSKNARVVELAPQEFIDFPRGYGPGPIRRVVKL